VPPGIRRIFNSAVVAYAMNAAIDLGLIDALRAGDPVHVHRFAASHGLDGAVVAAVCEPLGAAGFLSVHDDGTVTRGPEFEGADLARPFFHWLVGGNGKLLTSLPEVARGVRAASAPGEDPWGRNVRAVVAASQTAAAVYFDETLRECLKDVAFTNVADLGCGTGQRVIGLVTDRPGAHGIGVDIAEKAIEISQDNVARAGLGDRVTFVQEDVTALRPRPEFESVDLITSFLMGHDFWPRENAVRSLRMLRERFPNVRDFILCDEVRLPRPTNLEDTIFTMGFMLSHAAMDKYIPTIQEWYGVFADSGWHPVGVVRSGVPQSNVAFHLRPAGG
jgi:SAM-dependent methyltransferase